MSKRSLRRNFTFIEITAITAITARAVELRAQSNCAILITIVIIISCINNYSTVFVSYLQNMNTSGFRTCVKELYETRYDPVSVSYAVITG